MSNRIVLSIVSLLLFAPQVECFAAKPKQALNELTKVTVGPFDNFQSSFDQREQTLYYTRSQNLSSQIMRLELRSGLSSAITEIEADAKDPAISADGAKLAFTYFRDDAQGDVCILSDKAINCVTGRDAAEHSPFWITSDRLGFLQSRDGGRSNKILVYDIEKRTTDEVISGNIYSPSSSPDGQFMIYSNAKRELVLFSLADRSNKNTFQFSLPGTTGSARFSQDGRHIYFSQYMIDSNKDQKLDSRDVSAIFRVKLDGKGIPEAMTSAQQDCAYPVPTQSALYVSCAFEGTLDIYRLPLMGLIPDDWTEKDVREAHRAARTYSDRAMLLNHLHAKFKTLSELEYHERMMNDFILMRAWMTANYFADELIKAFPNNEQKFAAHKNLLESFIRWEALPSKEQVTELNRMIQTQESQLRTILDSPLKTIAASYLMFFAHKDAEAMKHADSISSDDPMTLYWQTNLMDMISEKQQNKSPYTRALEQRIGTQTLTEETRLFYLSRWIQGLPSETKSATSMIDGLKSRQKNQDASSQRIVELLDNEQQLRRIVTAASLEQSRPDMRAIVERAKRLKDHEYALRFLFSRGLIALDKGGKTRELSMLMSLWLSYVKPDTKEFPYVIEALRRNSLDVAYKFYMGPSATKNLAKGAFNDSLRTTDDLESHYQYALLQFSDAGWKELDTNYKSMVRDGLIANESLTFVNTLKTILNGKTPPKDGELKDAISVIDAIDDQHVGVGVKYLFLGYLNHRRLLLSKGSSDRDLAEKAHRAYIFAIDAAWNNERIKAAAYQNLGLLHLTVRNWSLAADFFTKRQEMGFESNSQRLALAWITAEALFKSYRAEEAYLLIDHALTLKPENRIAFLERHAFYAWNAGKYESAVKSYESVLGTETSSAGIYLGYGYSLMKLRRPIEAESALKKAIQISESTPAKSNKLRQDGLTSDVRKTAFVAKGLLARLDLPLDRKIPYLEQRISSFDLTIKNSKQWYLDARALQGQRIKEMFDLVMLDLTAASKSQASKDARLTIEATEDFGKNHGHLNQTVFAASKNVMLLTRDRKLDAAPTTISGIKNLLKRMEDEIGKDKDPSVSIRREWAEIQIIAATFDCALTDCNKTESLKNTIANILNSDLVKSLERDRPGSLPALSGYALRAQAY